jgi:pyridoxal phosphate-dependent aminotransferase EpsN
MLRTSGAHHIALSVPDLAPDVGAGLAEVLAGNWIAHVGPSVDAFERELAAKVGVPRAFATHSGTAALHLALQLCGVTRGDVVFCSALTFIASANPVLYQGARPVFIDSEPQSWSMSPLALERALHDARRAGELPKAIVVVQLYGQSADMAQLLALADAYGVPVIEDAAQALGATYHDQPCGTLGRVGVYSFAGNKIITTSAGGALVSHDEALVERARVLGMQGKSADCPYRHDLVGYNYRLSNVLAELGRSQLRVLEQRVRARRAVFARYRAALAHRPEVTWLPEPSYGRSNGWLSVLQLPEGPEPEHVVATLGAQGIECRRVFMPLHRQPVYAHRPYYAHGKLSVCDRLFAEGVCVPSSSSLPLADQERVVAALERLLPRSRPAITSESRALRPVRPRA